MKTFRLLFFLASVTAISVAFYACNGTDNPPAPSVAPVVSCPTPATQNVDIYQDIAFNFTFNYNSTTKKSLKKVKIVAKYTPPNTTETLLDTLVPANSPVTWTLPFIYSVSPTAPTNQIITITVTVEDIDGKIGSKVFTLTVKNLSDIIETIVTMGAQSNVTEGSYFSADSSKVYKSGIAKQSAYQPLIDFVYLNDDLGNGDCIAAPKDTILWDQTVNLCGSFSIKNATKFKQLPPMSDSVYNKIRTAAAISQLFIQGSGSPVGVIKSITDDGGGATDATIIVFKTVGISPQYGIIKVKLITLANPASRNTMMLNVKVSKK